MPTAMPDTGAYTPAPPCQRCGARRVEILIDTEHVVFWWCVVCGHIFGERRPAKDPIIE
jgi:hypothetical protein